MSVPARTLPSPAPAPRPARGPQPRVEPSPRPRPSTAPKTRTRARARRWHHPAFFLFAGIVVSVLVMGVVALNAMLVQTTYRMQTVRQQELDLSQQQVQLTDEAASLSSPENVARWARLHGLTMPQPGDTIILPVRGVASTSDPAHGASG